MNHATSSALCVSIHDVSEATWPACERLISLVQHIAPLPLTLLVVPRWHRMPPSVSEQALRFEQSLSALQRGGHELCLHGYVHLDEGPPARGPGEWMQRRVLTRSEGEFAALDASLAALRLQLGQAWFAARGWTARGFVPPAWLISAAAIESVRAAGFVYVGLYRCWLRAKDSQRLPAPSLTYSTRHPLGDALCRGMLQLIARLAVRWPLRWPVLRLALHPADLQRPANLANAQRLIEACLHYREPMTEYQAFARLSCYPIRKE